MRTAKIISNVPKMIEDLNKLGLSCMQLNRSINAPEYQDKEYFKRREKISALAAQYQLGQRIQEVQYTAQEHTIWTKTLSKLYQLHPKVMSQAYLKNVHQMEKTLNFSKRIPQMNDLSDYLKHKTGFMIKPVAGIIDSKQFLNCLAFKVFCSAQFVRHPLSIDYTIEPDLIHDYVGHIPMLADPFIAKISQKIGELSLVANDEDLEKLGAAYLFTIQYGLCLENGERKGYGAGFGGCVADLMRLQRGQYTWETFSPQAISKTRKIDYQKPFQHFYLAQSFQLALSELLKFEKSIKGQLIQQERYAQSILRE